MRTAVTKRYIDATDETKAKLAKAFDVTPKFVYMALTYRQDSETARKIRYTAVAHYGAKPMRHSPNATRFITRKSTEWNTCGRLSTTVRCYCGARVHRRLA